MASTCQDVCNVAGASPPHAYVRDRESYDYQKHTGVTQFNIYLMSGDQERCLKVYGNQIMPEFG